MSTDEHDDILDERLLVIKAARSYYLADRTKIQIAEDLGISRFKVARLLDIARDTGIVNITINDSPQPEEMLANQLRHRLRIRDCLVVPTGDAVSARSQVAAAAAGYLASRISSHDVLGLSWGRTLAAMTEYLVQLPPVKIVQLTGSVGSNLAISPIEIIRRATIRSGGEAFPIIAPLVASSVEAAAMMREQPEIRRAFDAFGELTMAVLSVGSWRPRTSQLIEYLDDHTRAELEAAGVEGEVAGVFLTGAGEVISSGQLDRFIGISAEQLRAVPKTIVVAEGSAKAGTVVAAVKAGLINSLVIDLQLARTMVTILDHTGQGD